jgi:hypothetical protein
MAVDPWKVLEKIARRRPGDDPSRLSAAFYRSREEAKTALKERATALKKRTAKKKDQR